MTDKEMFKDYMLRRRFKIDNSVGDMEQGTYFVFSSLGLSPGCVFWVGELDGKETYEWLGV